MVEIKVPVFPESVADGTLLCWHKSVGEQVKSGDVLAEIETDKVVFELPSMKDGVVEDQLVSEGAIVQSGQLIGHLREGHVTANEKIKPITDPATAPVAMPAAQRIIEQQNLDINAIQGTGKDGRILKEDVEKHIQSTSTTASKTSSTPDIVTAKADISLNGQRPQKRVPMTRLRARVAERLLEAQRTAAILTTFNEVNMQPIMNIRSKYQKDFEAKHGARLGFMPFFVQSVIDSLKKFPEVNASIEDDDIVYHGFFDIGIAVGSKRGLVVPIIRDADTLGMAEIELQIRDFGKRAQEGKLELEEITGGTFSISNGGVYGSMMSTPILNPPQSGILGMHNIIKRPIVENDEIVIRPMMYLAFSYDHRLIDGREAVQFLVNIKDNIENPERLLLGI
ncbi:MAG: 2-oxoglutarate dehydrogenase complex dihydrolipoyllysine-residue succinyltransferase [Gammaproteobacteria bacterium]|nr:2-oxoglutarate dehydrogenase complex dihydrolipoyllysine-residue succinyltransferase [Gammaproteobacteria bacterium]